MRPFLAGLLVTVILAACGSLKPSALPGSAAAAASARSPKAVKLPDTPAGAQFRWLIAATAHLPMSDAQARAHFDPGFLAQVSPAMLNQGLQGATDVKLVSIEVSQPRTLVAVASTGGGVPRVRVALAVDSRGLISGLRISPARPPPPPS